jgi:hypothetical protein
MLQQQDDVDLSANAVYGTDEEDLQRLMRNLTILFIFMSIIGVISCFYQIRRLQLIRGRHTDESTLHSATQIENQAEHVYKMKEAKHTSRAEINENLEREVDELRAFHREVRGELGTLRTALTQLSHRRLRQKEVVSKVEMHKSCKTE